MPQKEQQITCKSVFKNSDNTISKNQYTKKWIELINTLEKNKKINVGKQL